MAIIYSRICRDSLVNYSSLVPKINTVMFSGARRYIITSFACATQLNKQVQA